MVNNSIAPDPLFTFTNRVPKNVSSLQQTAVVVFIRGSEIYTLDRSLASFPLKIKMGKSTRPLEETELEDAASLWATEDCDSERLSSKAMSQYSMNTGMRALE